MGESDVSKRSIDKHRFARELDTSAGISYNGTTHTGPTKVGTTGEVEYENFYLEKGADLPPERQRALVDNADAVIALLPKDQQSAMRKQIEKFRENLSKG